MCRRNDRRTIVDRDHRDESVVLDYIGFTLASGMRIFEGTPSNWTSDLRCFLDTSVILASRENRVVSIANPTPRRTLSLPSRNTHLPHLQIT